MKNKYKDFFKAIEEKNKMEEKLLKSGIIEEITEFLQTSDEITNKFMWDDEFLYIKDDKKYYEELSTKMYLISSKAIKYANKYGINYEVNNDGYFRTGYCVFKYKDKIYFADRMSGQGTIYGLGVYKKDLCNNPLICEWDKILNDEIPTYPEEYKQKLIKDVKDQLQKLLDNYGLEIVNGAFNSLNKGEQNNEKNN